ncbi:MAG: peroxiredoxin, partial [Pseudothermotoga sp.]
MKTIKFNLVDQDNRKTAELDLLGKYTVLYFFPKANTSGCTKEAQEFSKQIDWFNSHRAQIYGVSKDSPETLKNFKEKYELKVNFLSDENCELAKALKVHKDGKTIRST